MSREMDVLREKTARKDCERTLVLILRLAGTRHEFKIEHSAPVMEYAKFDTQAALSEIMHEKLDILLKTFFATK